MKKCIWVFSLFLILFLFSCETTLNVAVNRPADVDLGTATSIAIEPIEYTYYLNRTEQTYAREVVTYLEYNLEREFNYDNYFRIIGTKDRRTPADVYLEGEIVRFEITDEQKVNKIKNPEYVKPVEGQKANKYIPEYIEEIRYKRSVNLIYRYQYVDGYSNRVLYKNEIEKYGASSWVLKMSELPDPYSLISSYLNDIVKKMAREIKPYVVNKTLSLMEVKDNSEMEYADKLAEKGYFDESYNKFIEIYRNTGMFEAYYNAAIVLQAKGELQNAKDMMKQLYLQTFDSRAERALKDIEDEIFYQSEYERQKSNRM